MTQSDTNYVQDLVAHCIDLFDCEGAGGVDEFLADNPHRLEVREHLAILSDNGLLSPPAPPSIQGYELSYRIGVGGMGEVWAANDLRTGTSVAIKTIRCDLFNSPRLIKRLQREVETVARLQHEVIVPVIDSGENVLGPWFAMPRVLGASLECLLNVLPGVSQGASPLALALEQAGIGDLDQDAKLFSLDYARSVAYIGASVADALATAHAAGVLHRDIKPSNILITPKGEVRLIDFGLARDELQSRMTATDSPMGSLAYMPPEQRAGMQDLDATADIHALGATLHELVTGKPPRPQDERGTSGSNPGDDLAPGGLNIVIEASIRPQRKHRYSSAAQLRDDLERVVAKNSPRPPRIPLIHRSMEAVRRHPALALGIALALGALLTWGLRGKAPQPRPPVQNLGPKFSMEEAAKLARRLSAIDRRGLGKKVTLEERLEINRAILTFYAPFLDRADKDIPKVALADASVAMKTLAQLNYTCGSLGETDQALENGLRAYKERLRRGDEIGQTLAEFAALERTAALRSASLKQLDESIKHFRNSAGYFRRARPKLDRSKHNLLDRRLAGTLGELANAHRLIGQVEESLAVWDTAISMADSNPKLQALAISLRGRKMLVLRAKGRAREAASLQELCVTAMKRMLEDPESGLSRKQRIDFLQVLAQDIHLSGQNRSVSDSGPYLAEVVKLRRLDLVEQPKHNVARVTLALALSNYGAHLARHDPEGATEQLQQSLRLLDELPKEHDKLADVESTRSLVLNNLSIAQLRLDPSRAAKYSEQAISALKELIESQPAQAESLSMLGGFLQNHANALMDSNRPREAVEVILEAIDAQERAFALNKRSLRIRSTLRVHLDELIALYAALNDPVSTVSLLKRVETFFENEPEEQRWIAELYWKQARSPEQPRDAHAKVTLEGTLRCIRRALNAGVESPISIAANSRLSGLLLEAQYLELIERKE
ncbi:MAG: serine/threonine-protein kinase [Planctomycetota bacterium]